MMPFHRWLWWSQFFALFINKNNTGMPPLEDALTTLNFNTPVYVNWLRQQLKNELLRKETTEEKLEYLKDLRIKYKLMPSQRQFVFNPSALSIKRSLTGVIKEEARIYGLSFVRLKQKHATERLQRLAQHCQCPNWHCLSDSWWIQRSLINRTSRHY
jgi:hypothetical protein